MTYDEQQLSALLDELPGYSDARFWRALKNAAGLPRIRSTMASAVRAARGGDFAPMAAFVLDVFDRDARLKELTQALAGHLGSTLRAQAWISDALVVAGRVKRAGTGGDPLGKLSGKW